MQKISNILNNQSETNLLEDIYMKEAISDQWTSSCVFCLLKYCWQEKTPADELVAK